MKKTTERVHARLRFAELGLAVIDGTATEWGVEARRYAQSTSDRVVSHGTAPPDSRSISMDNDSAQVFSPYATLRMCPTVVPHLLAKDSRSDLLSETQYSRSSMPDYHHKVTILSTPCGEFTKRYTSPDNVDMGNLSATYEIRRRNFIRLCEIRFQGNRSKLARKLDVVPAYVHDRIKTDGRTIGEKAARSIEQRVGLVAGQLDIQDSPLRMDETMIDRVDEDLRAIVDGLSDQEKSDALEFLSEMVSKRKKRRRA